MIGKQSGQLQMVILDIDFMIPEDRLDKMPLKSERRLEEEVSLDFA